MRLYPNIDSNLECPRGIRSVTPKLLMGLSLWLVVLTPTQVLAQTSPTPAAPVGLATSTSPSAREMIDPNTLVFHALKTAIAGPEFACKVHQQTTAYQQQVIMSGEYKSSGNWTGQFRYTARVSSGETTLDTIQVSDGRLMYTQFGNTSVPKLVNVEKVREQLVPRIYRPDDNPDVYISLAIGGQPELLRSLYLRYHWYRVVEGKVGGVDVWQLFGKLRTEAPKYAGTANLDRQILELNPDTENLPSHVRLTLGRPVDSRSNEPLGNVVTFPYFPYLIEYFRLEKNKEGRVVRLAPVSKIEYLEPTRQFKMTDTDFVYRIEPTTERIEEETSLYLK